MTQPNCLNRRASLTLVNWKLWVNSSFWRKGQRLKTLCTDNNRIFSLFSCCSATRNIYIIFNQQQTPTILFIQLSKVFSLKVKAFVYRQRQCRMTFWVRTPLHLLRNDNRITCFHFFLLFFPDNNKKTNNKKQSSNLCCISIRDDSFFSLFICLPLMKIHQKLYIDELL